MDIIDLVSTAGELALARKSLADSARGPGGAGDCRPLTGSLVSHGPARSRKPFAGR